jgi:PAS domain S-box-containing protein
MAISMTAAPDPRPPGAESPLRPGGPGLFEWEAPSDAWRCSPECAALLGHAGGSAPASGQEALAALRAEDGERVAALRRALTPAAPSYATTLRLRHPAGQAALLEERGWGLFDDGGRLLRVIGTLLEVTARTQAEEAQGQDTRLLATLVDSAMDAIVAVDEAHRIVAFNRAAERMFGVQASEVMNGPLDRLLPERTRERHREHLLSAHATRAARCRAGVPATVTGLRADGEEFPVEVSISQSEGPHGRLSTAILRDVSERVRADEALRRERAFLRTVIDATPSMVFVKDREGRFVLGNAALAACYASTVDGLVGKTDADFNADPGEVAHFQRDDREVIDTRRSRVIPEETVTTADGQTRWVTTVKVPLIEPDGTCDKVLGVATDITRLKEAEAALRDQVALQEQLTHVAAAVPGAICSFLLRADGSACFPYASPRIEDLYGVSREALARDAAPVFARVHPEDTGRMRAAIAESARTMTPWRDEFRFEHPQRGEVWVEGHSMPVRQADGSVLWHGYVSDISERKRLEQRLRDSERLYRAIGESIDYGVWVCDPDGRNTYASESFLRMVGITQEQCSNFGWGEVLHPEDAERTIAAWKECVRTGGTWDIEHRFRGVDGQWHEVLARGVPVRNEQGEVLCWAGINLDISRMKRAEADVVRLNKELQRRLAELQAILDTAPIGLSIADDPAGRHIRGNPAIERIFGLPAGAELSLGAAEPPAYRVYSQGRELAVDELPMQRAVHGVPVTGQLLDVVRGDGRRITLYSSAAPLFDEEGHPRGAVGAFLDITEIKRAEKALRDSEERFRLFMDNSPAVAWTKDERGRYVYLNKTYQERYAVRLSEWLGKTDAQLWPPESAESFWRNDRAVLAADRPMEFQEEAPDRDGTRRTWLAFKFPFRDHAGRRYVAGIGVDITDRRRAEEALQEESRRKDEFLAMLAHELRNPLTPIRNAAHIMRVLDPAEPRLRWVRDVIERQVAHLTRLVDDLLDVSRIVRGKVALQRETFDLWTLVHESLDGARPLIQAKGHRLHVRLPEGPVRIAGDRVRLSQVLLNLLDNAAKYTPSGGRIEVEARTESGAVVIQVRDNGSGIPGDLLPLVFNLFQQGERGLDRAQGGLGIGLTLVRRLAELHGGRVEARSPGPGQGSTFSVWLPLPAEPAARERPAAPNDQVPAGPRIRVLVVDDDAAVVESTALWLELEGHAVRTARTGPAALAQAREFRPDLVLLDIGLGGMDGYETAARLREIPGGERMSVVAVTGYGHEEARARSRDAGFDGHLVKPVDPAALADVLLAAAARAQAPAVR